MTMPTPLSHFDTAWETLSSHHIGSAEYMEAKKVFYLASLLMLREVVDDTDIKQAYVENGGCPNAEIGRILKQIANDAEDAWKYRELCK